MRRLLWFVVIYFLAGAVWAKPHHHLVGGAYAADYVHMDDTAKSWLALIGECDAVTGKLNWDATNEIFKCDTDGGGGGGGEINTASNLGGGLANFSVKVGVDLRFNSFDAADFDLVGNLIKIDDTKWAKDSEMLWSRAATTVFPLNAGDSVGDDAASTDWNISGAGVASFKEIDDKAGDIADAGFMRLASTDRIKWESNPASTAEPEVGIESDEIFTFEDRLQVTATTMTGAGIDTAVTACGTQPCDIHLLAGIYTSVCLRLNGKNNLRFWGRGVDVTILKPFTDSDNCTSNSEKQMIQIEHSDNIEFAYMTLDGDKENINVETCNASGAGCNTAITVRGPSALISKHTWIHDIKIIDFGGSGIVARDSDHAVIERNVINNMGCHQVDTPCGCGDDPGPCGGWTAAANIAGIVDRKQDGFGVQISESAAINAVVQNNTIDRAVKHGIEVFTGGAAAPCNVGSTALDSCYGKDDKILNNSVTRGSQGIVVNGGAHVEIRNNAVNLTGQTNGTGDIGTGILITGLSRDIVIANNTVTNGESGGITVKPISGGNVVVEGNLVTGNCTVTVQPAVQSSTSATEQARNLKFIDNTIIQNPLCTMSLDMIDTGTNGILGSNWLLGGTYDAGTLSAVLINSHNIFVAGTKINGNWNVTANAFGLSMDNDISGTVVMGGNILNLALSGSLIYNDKDNDRAFDAGEEITTGGPRQFDVWWKAPTLNDDQYVRAPHTSAITLTQLDCIATGGVAPNTFKINIDECNSDGTAASCNAGPTGGTVTLNALTTDITDNTWTDSAIGIDHWIRLDINSFVTAPDYVHCKLEYTQP